MLMVRLFNELMRHTLRSVVFGICLMVAIAVYIAVGSSQPAVREFFERDEQAFFNWWPLSTLMFLLVANVITVTLDRIPFTPPRYGVWCVHAGIVTLVAGGYWHYSQKVEGTALVGVGQTVDRYYDRWERALYARVGGTNATAAALPKLPRFGTYKPSAGLDSPPLNRKDLGDVSPTLRRLDNETQSPVVISLGERVGVPDLRFDVVGYYPYADVMSDVVEDAASSQNGIKITFDDGHDHGPVTNWLMTGDPRYRFVTVENFAFEQLDFDSPAKLAEMIATVRDAHELKVSVDGVDQTISAAVGARYVIGNTGYALRVESFMPAWRTIDGETVQMLTLLVESPKGKFLRQVINGRDKITDFKPGEPNTGPMGKRQSAPLDDALKTSYTFKGDSRIMPGPGMMRNMIVTVAGSPAVTMLSFGINDPLVVNTLNGQAAKITLPTPRPGDETGMLLSPSDAQRPTTTFELSWHDHVIAKSWVEETPREKRDKETGAGGGKQVIVVRASGGGQSELVYVPFSLSPYDIPWQGGLVKLVGMTDVVQLQLGNSPRPLPARIKLDKFEAQSYAGLAPRAGIAMRDFRSYVTLTDRQNPKRVTTGIIAQNEPVFYANGGWLFFQSGWDDQGQKFSWIGVGNRPGVGIMVTGCVMIFTGLLYAFYVKPILIRVRKEKAVRAAVASGKLKPQKRVKAESAVIR